MSKVKVISIIGPSADKCSAEVYEFGVALGKALVDSGYFIACGGRFGLMEAVCKGAHLSANYCYGATIGLIPSENKAEANKYCDIVIPTGMGIARNALVVNTGDVIVAVAGGSGTLSELAMAWQMGKKVICYTGFGGWAKDLAGNSIDEKEREAFLVAGSVEEIIAYIQP